MVLKSGNRPLIHFTINNISNINIFGSAGDSKTRFLSDLLSLTRLKTFSLVNEYITFFGVGIIPVSTLLHLAHLAT